jgi:Transglycosylase SLT domain
VRRLSFLIAFLVLVAALAGFALLREDSPPELGPLEIEGDPFAYESGREDEFEARATAGHSHVIYEKSPGGVMASARRVAPYRAEIEEIAGDAGVDPDLVEGMVLLESAGRPDAMASDDLEGAVGLTQILAVTASELLGMRVDVRESRRLTRRIQRADRAGDSERSARLRARRRRVDERFDPTKALEGTGRYLQIAMEEFEREDLAVVSYHMGIGNLQNVLGAYGEDDASYTKVFFDATPDRHPQAHGLLNGLGDDSKTYLWRVLASAEVMRLHREDPAELARLDALHSAKASAEEVLHPRAATDVFSEPADLDAAYVSGALRPFPNDPVRYGLRRDPRMGQLAPRVDAERVLYRGLRPEAFALAVYLGDGVRGIADTPAPLIVTSTVRDQAYQDVLARSNSEATRGYSLHTTGFSFDVRRRYRSRRQAEAFQYMLDRLQALNLIAWVREPGAIHITASSEARRLLARQE